MENWKLSFVLLLLLTACFDSEVTVVKTIGREPNVTPICSNVNIVLLMCEITPESSSEECRLLYQHGRDFEYKCDSRFTLMMENQTVFLHLTNLTPVDSGTYTCECSYPGGSDILRLNITVEEVEVTSKSAIHMIHWIVATIVTIIITGVLLGFICRRIHRGSSRSTSSGCETPGELDNNDPDDHYTSLQHPASDLYQTI